MFYDNEYVTLAANYLHYYTRNCANRYKIASGGIEYYNSWKFYKSR